MAPKLPKALLAAGLAAALVGCGGGSSTTTTTEPQPTEPTAPAGPTPAETAAGKIQASYNIAKGLVDGLTVSSTEAEIKSARDRAIELQNQIAAETDLDSEASAKFTTDASMLLTSIRSIEEEKQTAADAAKTAADAAKTAADAAAVAAQQAAAKERVQASYDIVKGLVDGLTTDSTAEDIESVRTRVNALLDQIPTTTDLGSEDRTKFITDTNMLLTSIMDVEDKQKQMIVDANEAADKVTRDNYSTLAALVNGLTTDSTPAQIKAVRDQVDAFATQIDGTPLASELDTDMLITTIVGLETEIMEIADAKTKAETKAKIQASYNAVQGLVLGLVGNPTTAQIDDALKEVNMVLTAIMDADLEDDQLNTDAKALRTRIITLSYNNVKAVVDGLTVDSTTAQIESAEGRVTKLVADATEADGLGTDMLSAKINGIKAYKEANEAVMALTGASSTTEIEAAREKVTELTEKIEDGGLNTDMLLAGIKTVEDDKANMASVTPWKTSLEGHTLKALDAAPTWPSATTLAGTPTPVTGLPDGWTGMKYDYRRSATHEQGKTFSMEVEKVTPEIEITWARLAALSSLTDRGEIIDDALGGKDIDVELASNNSIIVMQEVANPVITSNEASEQTNNPFNDENGKFIKETQFQESDFKPINAESLIAGGIVLDEGENIGKPDAANTWYNLSEAATFLITSADTESTPRYVMWNGVPAKLTVAVANVSTVTSVRLRFKDGVLEFVPVGEIGTGNPITLRIAPVSASNFLLPDTELDPLTLQEGKTTTATTEFAYWASQNQSSSVVTLSTFARGMAFEPVTTTPVALTDEATYNGLAAGYYAMGTESNGEFTADAMLTANFGTNMIDGTISNFMDMAGEDNLSSWSLRLDSASFINNQDTDDTMDDRFMAFSGNTSGGGALGKWNGQFLGEANPGINLEEAADMTDDYPEAVVGNFTGHFANNGHVVGAFGTDLEE